MQTSILLSTKEVLGLPASAEAFDLQIVTHINTVFGLLNQLGVGPSPAFVIEDEMAKWADLELPPDQLSVVRSYIFLRVQMLWDMPTTSYAITAKNEQIKEFEWRLNVMREEALPT
jgi:hypothetical protein